MEQAEAAAQFPPPMAADVPCGAGSRRDLFAPPKIDWVLDAHTVHLRRIRRQILALESHAEVQGERAQRPPCVLKINARIVADSGIVVARTVFPDVIAVSSPRRGDAAARERLSP